MSRGTGLRLALGAVAVVGTGTLVTSWPAAGQPALPAGDALTTTVVHGSGGTAAVGTTLDRIDLLAQSPYVEARHRWMLDLKVAAKDPGREYLRLTVYSRLTTRTDFELSLSGREPGNRVWRSADVSLTSLRPAADGGVALSIPVDEASSGIGLPTFSTGSQSAVYPLQVELLDGRSTAAATLNTSLVYVGGTPSQTGFPKLNVTATIGVASPTVLPLRPAALSVQATPEKISSSASHLTPAATAALEGEIAVLERHAAVPVNLDVNPQAVEGLAAVAGGAGIPTLTRASAARTAQESLISLTAGFDQLLPATYVATSLPALQAADLSKEITAQVLAGSTTLGDVVHRVPSTSTWVVDGPVDAITLRTLHALGATHLILPAADLSALPAALQVSTFAAPAMLSTEVGRFSVDAADAGLTAHFVSGGGQVLAAEQLLADLAMIQTETPARMRGVAVVPPPSWLPDPTFLETFLAGLDGNPLLQATTANGLFAAVPAATSDRTAVVRGLVAGGRPVAPLSEARTILVARAGVEAYRALLPGSGPAAGELARRLLLTESSDLKTAERSALLTSIVSAAERVDKSITLPGSSSITLTARKGNLPLSIISNPVLNAHVELRLSSNKLTFESFSPAHGHCSRPAPSTESCQLVLTAAVTTVRVPVETRTSGVFTLEVTLLSPDGSLELGGNRDTVRSTVVSGVGVALIILAFLGLAYWWIRNIRHGRRAQQLIEPDLDSDLDANHDPHLEPGVPSEGPHPRQDPERGTPGSAPVSGGDPDRNGETTVLGDHRSVDTTATGGPRPEAEPEEADRLIADFFASPAPSFQTGRLTDPSGRSTMPPHR